MCLPVVTGLRDNHCQGAGCLLYTPGPVPPGILEPAFLSTGQSCPGLLLPNLDSRGCDWIRLGKWLWIIVLNRSLGLSSHQEIHMVSQICPWRTKPPGNNLSQDYPGGLVVQTPLLQCKVCCYHTQLGNWDPWLRKQKQKQRRDSLTFWVKLKIISHLESKLQEILSCFLSCLKNKSVNE